MPLNDELKLRYSGNTLNRLSFKREDSEFLELALNSLDTRFVGFVDLNPVLLNNQLRLFSLDEIRDFLNSRNYVFLGIDESTNGFSGDLKYPGSPRFAIDLPPNPNYEVGQVYFGLEIPEQEYSIVAEGRMLLDWLNRVKFCGSCGSPNKTAWGGFKLKCVNKECQTQTQISNLQFPRTDCCVIAAILSFDMQNVLIAKGIRFKRNMYSCLAGFIECGESVEDCVRREAYEEAGVKVGSVEIVASQPWPFPANLMIGCIAKIADASSESHKIHLEHDKELVDAIWIPIKELEQMCLGEQVKEFSLPPKFSIAWTLLNKASQINK